MYLRTILLGAMILLGTATDSYSNFVSGSFVNPGIKIGCALGKGRADFTIGIETSFTFCATPLFYFIGAVGGAQYVFNRKRFYYYLEGELGCPFLGIAIGRLARQCGDFSCATFRAFTGIPTIATMHMAMRMRYDYPITSYASWRYLFSVHESELSAIVKYPILLQSENDWGITSPAW